MKNLLATDTLHLPAPSMMALMPKAATRVPRPAIRSSAPIDSPRMTSSARGAGRCRVSVKNVIVPSKP